MTTETSPVDTPKKPASMAGRYLFMLLIGLMMGVVGVVMLMRSLESRKTWRDHYPHATMQLISAHMAQYHDKLRANRCNPTDLLPHLQALRSLGNDLEPAFADLRDDQRFIEHAGKYRATLDEALSTPPLNCNAASDAIGAAGATCKSCHQDFRG